MAIPTVCVDENDFQTDPNGRLQLNPTVVQSGAVTFTHTLGGVNTFEEITELGDVVAPVAGLYEVTFDAHGNATNTPAAPGTIVSTSITACLAKNDVLVANSEAMLQLNSQGTSTVDQPALQMHGAGSCTLPLQLAAGDRISLYGKRNSSAGTTSQVVSDSSGRCRITLIRLGSA